MISSYKELILKTSELEEKIEQIENLNLSLNDYSGYSNKLNLSVVHKRNINVLKINNNKNNLRIQFEINFTINSNQEIEFSLIVNNNTIKTKTSNFLAGNNTLTFNEQLQDTFNNVLQFNLVCNPIESKQVIIKSIETSIWGIKQESQQEYSAIETTGNIIVSFISNKQLFIKYLPKNAIETQQFYQYEIYNNSISHSLSYNTDDDTVCLFHIDLHSNLFYTKLDSNQNTFICNNTSKVSSVFHKNKLIFCYISEGKAMIGEIANNVFVINPFNQIIGDLVDCYMYSNNEKLYLILTKEDGSNYLLENIHNSLSSGENINAELNLTINTYEAKDEI